MSMGANGHKMNVPRNVLDTHLDRVLRAAGSALRHYSMPATVDALRDAMQDAIQWGYIAGRQDQELDQESRP